ncbi:unnamed protein product [Adineta steineri]|uniref:Uncharacterized protein n=1 Tax=Adineta steineri TaxID=433720 RepID=A0A814VGW4_9BILA|nr:unnamed protein product [Adineta steineri]
MHNWHTAVALYTFCIYIIFITVAYFILFKSPVNTLLTPAKRPHDRNFVSKISNHQSTILTDTNTRDLLIVTTVSAGFVDRLENLIGSIHYHEPHRTIIVFDLGMTNSQRSRILCMASVQVENFPFDAYPSHVTYLQFYAFKALVLKEAFEKYRWKTKAIFYLDAGCELRSSLDPIIKAIKIHGYFLTGQKTFIINRTDDQTFVALNVSKSSFSIGKYYQVAACILGFSTNHSGFYKNILIPFIACSLNSDCIAPLTSRSSTTHHFDQSILSIIVYKAGYIVERSERFFGDFGSPFELDKIMVIFSRRWHCPKVYTSEVVFRNICNYSSIFAFHSPIENVHELTAVYPCGKLTLLKLSSFKIELPVYQVHRLIFISYFLLMIGLYCTLSHITYRAWLSTARTKQRRMIKMN